MGWQRGVWIDKYGLCGRAPVIKGRWHVGEKDLNPPVRRVRPAEVPGQPGGAGGAGADGAGPFYLEAWDLGVAWEENRG